MLKSHAHEVLEKIEKEAFNSGFKAGENAGFIKGWERAAKSVNEALKKPPVTTKESIDVFSSNPPPKKNPFKPESGQSKVYEYIKANPGKQGFEIISGADVSAKTARNTFHRLKKRGLASNEDGWKVL